MKFIIANWKCNPETIEEAKLLFNMVKEGVGDNENRKVIICPPFTYLTTLNLQHSTLKLGGQNCFFRSGAFTGEISPQMLKDLGCEYVIIGHSERRALGETDELINKKMKAVLEMDLNPILCIGENQEERQGGKTKEVLKSQLQEGLKDLSFELCALRLILAYEPIWAIGSDNACSFEVAKEVKSFIREILDEILGRPQDQEVPILYGGSVKSNISAGYISNSGMDGLLVGGASLDAGEFLNIVKSVKET